MTFLMRLLGALLAPLLLTGCLLTPGHFVSDLAIERDGRFSFTYRGEIVLFTQAGYFGAMTEGEGIATETEPYCFKAETGQRRPCTDAEVAEQRRQSEAVASSGGQSDEFAQMREMMGGLDPGDPATMDAFAARLAREEGWRSVVHRGEGVFEVDYAVTGTLDRGFVFPLYPEFDFAIPMVTITRRNDGTVMVRAPAFAAGGGGALAGGYGAGGPNPFARADGIFTIRTSADILTNNTETGPIRDGQNEVLAWTVSAVSNTRPEALIRLASGEAIEN